MKPRVVFGVVFGGAAVLAGLGAIAGSTSTSNVAGAPRYDALGRLLFPADYRDWVFLSSGLNMSYSDAPDTSGMNMFGNTFAPRTAYTAFEQAGRWPDKTVLIIENRTAATKGSINKRGQFQTLQTMGFEAHVKDVARFKGGWGFFGFGNDRKAAVQIPYAAQCYSCHQDHAAADTTFVQFYPTLLPIAARLKTLNPAYVAEEKATRPLD